LYSFSATERQLWQKLAETCFCQTGLNRFKPRFKLLSAETYQPWYALATINLCE